jgi:type III secretory pathway component EscT
MNQHDPFDPPRAENDGLIFIILYIMALIVGMLMGVGLGWVLWGMAHSHVFEC